MGTKWKCRSPRARYSLRSWIWGFLPKAWINKSPILSYSQSYSHYGWHYLTPVGNAVSPGSSAINLLYPGISGWRVWWAWGRWARGRWRESAFRFVLARFVSRASYLHHFFAPNHTNVAYSARYAKGFRYLVHPTRVKWATVQLSKNKSSRLIINHNGITKCFEV